MTRVDKKTEKFISKYLGQDTAGKGEDLFDMIAESKGANKMIIARVIRQMDYEEFLSTPYWHLVARQVKRSAHWQCQECGSHTNLVAHHVHYRLHGYEMYRVKELRCLCQACHERHHGLRA